MTYEIDDFILITDTKTIKLEDQIIKPTQIGSNGKKPERYEFQNKTKEITVFDFLSFKENKFKEHYSVIDNIFVFIDLIEVLKAFAGNKLNTKKEYNLSDKFTAKTTQKDGDMYLKIHFKNYSNSLYLDKFECSSLAAKFQKILSKCEAYSEV